MPAATRNRRADAERSIAAIVDAAVELVSRRPEANMSEVAAAAGVGRVTLYAHFPSREAVLAASRERAMAETIRAFDAAELDRGPAPDALARPRQLGRSSTATAVCWQLPG
jgi:AcrR family transcriptional regulator